MKDSLATQEALLPFLLNPLAYPHRPPSVQLRQTHASFVFLAPPFVFKIKKSVNLGFLDFSTLEKRRHFCRREVELNRRLSPDIYLGVVPISHNRLGFTFGHGDEVVEYAVQMRLLPDGFYLDQLVRQRQAGRRELNRIAAVLRQFYTAQHPSRSILAWGRLTRIRASTDENFRQTRRFVGRTLSRPAYHAVRSFTAQFYAQHRPLFASRIQDHRIRDCHGDLHLEHIHLTPHSLHIYDCIEFNDRFRYLDVANDVAFLAMDLDFAGRPDLARHFASRMSRALRDDGMSRLLDFYKCYRAYVRGKVESLHALSRSAPNKERMTAMSRARRYFQLALRYAVAGSTPMVLAVMGRVASGKSTLARALGAELGWEVHNSDSIRKSLAGVPNHRRGNPSALKRLYSEAMTAKTYRHLIRAAELAVRHGRSVILDATFARADQRALLDRSLGRRAIAWRILELHAGDTAVKRRLRNRQSSPRTVSDARLADFETLSARYEPPDELPDSRKVRVKTAGAVKTTLAKSLGALAQLQAMSPVQAQPPMRPARNPASRSVPI